MANDDDQEAYWQEIGRRRLAGELTKSESAAVALSYVKRLAEQISTGAVDPLRPALDIYTFAWMGGGWDDDEPSQELQHWGAEFIQLHDALERHQADEAERRAWSSLIRDAATAMLAGDDFPSWRDDGKPFPVRQAQG